MKRVLPVIIIFSLLLIPTPVFSQTTVREKAASMATEFKENVLERRETIASKAAERKDDRIAKLEAARVKLRTKLGSFKDRVKAAAVERIDDRLDRVNQTRTAAMSRHLDHMSAILIRVETRVGERSISSESSASVSASIAVTKTKIETAKLAVDLQATKVYSLNVSSETRAKIEVKTVRDSLHKDLKATHDLVVEARRSLAETVSLVLSSI